MSGNKSNDTYVVVDGPDVDLETEVVLDGSGRRIDQAYVDEVVEEFHAKGRGRPSLSGASEKSPQVTFRIAPDVKRRAEELAAERGTTVSTLARLALENLLAANPEPKSRRLVKTQEAAPPAG